MNWNPKRLIDAIACADPSAQAHEWPEYYEVRRAIAGADEAKALVAAAQDAAIHGLCAVTIYNVIDDEVSLAELLDKFVGDGPPPAKLTLRIRVNKTPPTGIVCFFTCSAFVAYLHRISADRPFTTIAVWEGGAGFSTAAMRVTAWGENTLTIGERAAPEPVSPRKIVRDLSGNVVVADLRPWLLVDPPSDDVGEAFTAWRTVAAERLATAMAAEVWRQEDVNQVAFKGPRTVKTAAGDFKAFDPAAFSALNAMALWVYGGGADADARHALINHELAHDWPKGMTLAGLKAERIIAAMSHAQDAYRLHVQGASKDALKALADLRKALNDETDKVAGQTRELITSMWRDFSTALALLTVRFAATAMTGAAKGGGTTWMDAIMIGAAGYLLFSYWATSRANARMHAVAAGAREKWRARLYGFLGEDEYEKMAAQPVRAALEAYHDMKTIIRRAYYGAAAVMAGVGGYGLLSATSLDQWTPLVSILWPA